VVWNVIFDHQVRKATDEYVYRQTLHERGLGPGIGMDELMRPAIRHAFRLATGWSTGIVVGGLALLRYSALHHPRTRGNSTR
jgi:hypothetical protein